MDLNLEGRVALITGASRGIGRAIAAAFVEAGASVMLSARREETLAATAAAIGGDVEIFPANGGDVDAAEACVLATIERFGALDILVNNAATNPYFGPMMGIDPSRFDKTIQVNLRGPLFWSQAAWNHAMKDRPGVIVNISSGGSVHTDPGLGVYNLTKAALNHFTKILASEIAPTRVVCVAPGLIKTDFSKVLVDNFGDALAARLPTGRLGEPDDIASLVVFVASDRASYITGETIMCDGGIGSLSPLA